MVEALELLYCEVLSIYNPCVNEMMTLMEKIDKCLKCITDPKFDRSVGITKAIDIYFMKLKELADLQKEALEKIIKALEVANIIVYCLCAVKDKENQQDFVCDALEQELERMLEYFGNCLDCDGDKDPMKCEPLRCDLIDKELSPVPVMPICKNPYFKTTKSEYDDARGKAKEAKDTLDSAKKKYGSAFACYNGVKNAMEASKAAKAL